MVSCAKLSLFIAKFRSLNAILLKDIAKLISRSRTLKKEASARAEASKYRLTKNNHQVSPK